MKSEQIQIETDVQDVYPSAEKEKPPAHDDRLILDALAKLLSDELEPVFLNASPGFGTFFFEVSKWPEIDGPSNPM